MRQDPLLMAQKPYKVYERLPGEFKTSYVLSEFNLWDRWADTISGILMADSEEDFKHRISRIKPLTTPITLQNRVDILGCYDSGHQRITVDDIKISKLASQMRGEGTIISDADLQEVIEIHELQHALHHLAEDTLNDNSIWHEFSNAPSYLLEILAQLFTYELCHSKKELDLAFIDLERRQPLEYRLWRLFRFVPKEGLYWIIREQPFRIVQILEKCGIILPDAYVSGWNIKRIAKIINDDKQGNVCPKDLPKIVEETYHYPANVHPNQVGQECFQTAFFFSLTSRRYSNPTVGHLDFRQMLDCLISHEDIFCDGVTKQVILITDNWNADSWEESKPILDNIRQKVVLRVYLLSGANYSEIRV